MKIKEIRELSAKDLRERIETEKVSLGQIEVEIISLPLENTLS